MLTIRAAQADEMLQARREKFLCKLIADVQADLGYDRFCHDADALTKSIEEMVELAIRSGLNRECDAAALVFLLIGHFGPMGGLLAPPAMDILCAELVPPEDKLAALERFMDRYVSRES